MNSEKRSLDQLDKSYFNPAPAPFEGSAQKLMLKQGVADFQSVALPVDLTGAWQMAQDGDLSARLSEEWQDAITANVPGSVQTALFEAGEIPDPYFGRQDEIARETSRHTWWLRKAFDFDDLSGSHRLSFMGVADRCTVWFNGRCLGSHQGMFDRFDFDVSDLLQPQNDLIVRLDPAPYRIGQDQPNPFFKGMNVGWLDSVVINNIFGWHYINLPTIGIWQPVELDETPNLNIQDPYVVTMDLESGLLRLVFDLNMNLSQAVKADFVLQINPNNFEGKTCSATASVMIEPHQENLVFEFELPEAAWWWPVGYGHPNLYHLRSQLTLEDGSVSQAETNFGVRTVAMRPTPEGPDPEKYDWTFVINGIPIFIKGTNWCTCDALLRFSEERYERFISLAADSHINLLRAWGSGMPETEAFYDLCDRYGVMVLQEWPTAWDSHKIQPFAILEATVKDGTRRMRSHPSLVMYGGGNESPDPSGRAIEMMGAAAYELDGTRAFHRGEPFGGSIHNYDVYWGRQRLDRNLRLAAPFIGEFGLASVPPMTTVNRYVLEDELDDWPPSPEGGFVHHMPVFNLKGGMARMVQYAGYFTTPDSLSALSLGTQMAQATGIRHALELARTRWPEHTGVCYYKINDNNPAASWSSVDWFGTQKIAYHVLRQSYRPLLPVILFESLSIFCMESTLPVFLLDDLGELEGSSWEVVVHVLNDEVEQVLETTFTGKGQHPANQPVGELVLPAEATQSAPLFIVVDLVKDNQKSIRQFYWLNFESHQNALFELPLTTLALDREEDAVVVKNTGSKPAVGVHFVSDDPDSFVCEDAYFWLNPGESRRIKTNQSQKLQVSAWNHES